MYGPLVVKRYEEYSILMFYLPNCILTLYGIEYEAAKRWEPETASRSISLKGALQNAPNRWPVPLLYPGGGIEADLKAACILEEVAPKQYIR